MTQEYAERDVSAEDDPGVPGIAWRTLKNAVYSMIGFVWPILIALFTSPFIVHRLGTDLYGLLSIVGVTLGFFGFLDLGVGGAAVRQIAVHFERDEHEEVGKVVSTIVAFYLGVGAVAALVLLLMTETLVTRLLGIPADLWQTARTAFYVAAPSFMVSLVVGVFHSVPQAVQRYDISTKISLVMSTVSSAATVTVLLLGGGIIHILVAGLAMYSVALPIVYRIARRLSPGIRPSLRLDMALLRQLVSYGSFFLLASIGTALLLQLDKLLISGFLGVAMVAYYVIPGNLAQKIHGLVGAATAVVFPMTAALTAADRRETLLRLYRDGMRLVFTLVMTLAVPMVVFARPFLKEWMGADIASNSAVPMMLLVATYSVLSLGAVAWSIANGSGHARINAMSVLVMAAVDVAAFLLLVGPFGLPGAAVAFLIAAIVGTPIQVLYVERRVLELDGLEWVRLSWRSVVVALVQTAVCIALRSVSAGLILTIGLMAVGAVLHPALYWAFGFMQEGDRRLVSLLVQRIRH